MQCPACGSAIWNEQATACPTCGQRLSGGGAPSSDESQPSVWPGNSAPEAGDTPAPSVVTSLPPPAFALAAAPPKPSSAPPPDPGLRRRIVLVITTIVLAVIALYGGGLGVLALVEHQLNAPRPETVVYQNSLKGFPGGWPEGASCAYGSDGYHIDGNAVCFADTDPLSDVAVTVTVTQV